MERMAESRIPAGRWLTILAGTLCVSCPWASHPAVSAAFALALLATVGLLVTVLVRGTRRALVVQPVILLMMVTAGGGILVTSVLTMAQRGSVAVIAGLSAAVLVLSAEPMWSGSAPSLRRLALPALAYLTLITLLATSWTGVVDVKLFVQGGLDAILDGRSPYGITVDNVYSPALAERYYGPGVVQGNQIVYGYPYLPALLVLDLPLHLLADALWMHMAGMALAVVLAWQLASDHLGRAAVMMLALSPSVPFLLVNYYVEPLMVGILAVVVWGMCRQRTPIIVAGLGFFFASKQYAVFYLPSLWPVARSAGWRVVLAAAGLGSLLVGTFVLIDPHGFYRSVVELQLVQPFRQDSISLLPVVRDAFGVLPGWVLVVVPLAGLAVSGLVATRTRPGPTAFALCVGLGLLVSVLFAKQAFANYYLVAGAALLMAGVTWPDDDPTQMRDPSSQGSRGERGISRTR